MNKFNTSFNNSIGKFGFNSNPNLFRNLNIKAETASNNSSKNYTNFRIKQETNVETNVSVHASKVGEIITLSFPAMSVACTANTNSISSFVILESSLLPLQKTTALITNNSTNNVILRFEQHINSWYMVISQSAAWTASTIFNPFTFSYRSANSTSFNSEAGTNWGNNYPDFARPTLGLVGTSIPSHPTTRTVNINFNEPVINFTIDDITVVGGTKDNFIIINSSQYTVDFITNAPNVDYTVQIPANVCTDLSGNLNTASNLLLLTPYSSLISPQNLSSNTSNNNFKLTRSSMYNNYDVFYMFSSQYNWITEQNTYVSNGAATALNSFNPISGFSGGGGKIDGAWFKIELNEIKKINFYKILFQSQGETPENWNLYGSNTNDNYVVINTVSGYVYEDNSTFKTFTMDTAAYKFFVFHCTKIFPNSTTRLSMNKMQFGFL